MNKKKIIFVIILVLLVGILAYFLSNINNNKSYVNKIDYDMKISFCKKNMPETGYASTLDYILINTQTKTAHYINHFFVMVDNPNGNKDKYKVKKFTLNNSELELLIEYSNKISEEINNDYIIIEFENKTIILNESSAQEILNFIDKR